VWVSIFHMDQPCRPGASFPDRVEWIFESVRNSAGQYPNFLTAHSLGFATAEKGKAKSIMEEYLKHMRAGMTEALDADAAVRRDAFSETFSEKDFLDFVLSSVLGLLLQQKTDCRVLLEMIRRTIY